MGMAAEVDYRGALELAGDQHFEPDFPLGEERAPDQHQELSAAPHLAGGRARWHYATEAEGLAEGQAVGGPGNLGQLPRVPPHLRHVVPESRDDQGYSGATAAHHADNDVGRLRPRVAGERPHRGRSAGSEAVRVCGSAIGGQCPIKTDGCLLIACPDIRQELPEESRSDLAALDRSRPFSSAPDRI